MPYIVNRQLRPWIAALNDVRQRVDAAEALGIDLATFTVTCRSCNTVSNMSEVELIDHIDKHLIAARREAA